MLAKQLNAFTLLEPRKAINARQSKADLKSLEKSKTTNRALQSGTKPSPASLVEQVAHGHFTFVELIRFKGLPRCF